ncbi:hypothetical protein CA982_02145 [Gordonia lacunae]|uniref:SSD domain-containing protein n=1 Tax=Gordonia lacunae TaxID=417102 RepID=A0A243QGQ2_9ACTN|nr:hypothetical protein CA982_02145 [Gordonia lacunae]
MARLLYRVGAFSATHRKTVIAAWVAILVAVIVGMMAGPQTDGDDFEIPGTESSDAMSTLNDKFPTSDAKSAGSLPVVFHMDGLPLTDSALRATVDRAVEEIGELPEVVSVTNGLSSDSPKLSEDQDTAVSTVSYRLADDADKTALHDRLEAIADQATDDGVRTVVGGDLSVAGPHLFGPSEIIGVAIAFLVLMITYGSLAAAGINMLTALIGVAVGIVGVLGYSAFSPIQPTTPILAVMLGLAVGIDYALFVVARFRAELRSGRGVTDAIGQAVGTAGSAVVFAGATVVVALAGLSVVGVPFLAEMGLAAAFAVVVAVGIALTLLPVALALGGRRLLPRAERADDPEPDAAEDTTPSFFERWGALVARRPGRVLVPAVLALTVLAIPVMSLQTSLSTPGGSDPSSSQREAYDLISAEFGAGSQSPLVVLVDSDNARLAGERTAEAIAGLPGVASVSPATPSADNSAAMISVTSMSGPDEERTSQLVGEIRSAVTDIPDASVAVTGETAVSIDVNDKLHTALITYIVLIVGLAFLLLVLLFRSLFVPLVATLGFLLSLGAGMGASVAVFQWNWLGGIFGVDEGAPILSFLPIIVVGILFGLAMDYQVFLGSRIHEAHSRGLDTREAIIEGFSRSGPVVVAAAAIMAAVFAGFCLSGDSLVGSIALALTVGVLTDAFVVRMLIMPAALALFGNRSWWLPATLDRLLPRIDAEGLSIGGSDSGDRRRKNPVDSAIGG